MEIYYLDTGENLFIQIKKLRVHYKVLGDGENLILLHGWGCNLTHFEKLQLHLAKRFKTYAIDLPGFGLSSVPERIWDSADYAECITELIKKLAIDRPIILGHSLGGKVAICLVAAKQIEVSKIILVGTPGLKLSKNFKVSSRILFFKIIRLIAKLPLFKSLIASKLERYRQRFGSEDYRNASGLMRQILVKVVNEDLRALLSEIHIPTLLIWGDKDQTTLPRVGQLMQEIIQCEMCGDQSRSKVKLEIIPNAGHFPFFDNFDRFVEVLEAFLKL